jgi:hypothetical protein
MQEVLQGNYNYNPQMKIFTQKMLGAQGLQVFDERGGGGGRK